MLPELSFPARLLSEQEYRMGRWNLGLVLQGSSVTVVLVAAVLLALHPAQLPLLTLGIPAGLLFGVLLLLAVEGRMGTGQRGVLRLEDQELVFLPHRLRAPVRHAAIDELDCVQRGGAVLRIGVRGEPDWYLLVSLLEAEDLYELLVDPIQEFEAPCPFGEAERLPG